MEPMWIQNMLYNFVIVQERMENTVMLATQ